MLGSAWLRIVIGCCAAASLASVAGAQSFDINWQSIDGGGVTFSTGGVFEIGGAIGQPDSGTLTGGQFTVTGGFWAVVLSSCNLAADLNGSGGVDLSDLSTLLANFGVGSGATHAGGDVDNDGDVDLTDLSALLAVFGTSC